MLPCGKFAFTHTHTDMPCGDTVNNKVGPTAHPNVEDNMHGNQYGVITFKSLMEKYRV